MQLLFMASEVNTHTYPHDIDFMKPGTCRLAYRLKIMYCFLYDVANNFNGPLIYLAFTSHRKPFRFHKYSLRLHMLYDCVAKINNSTTYVFGSWLPYINIKLRILF